MSSLINRCFHCLIRVLSSILPAQRRANLYRRLEDLGEKAYLRTELSVQRVPGGVYIKRGSTALQEAEAIRIVRRYTTIPSPEVLDAVEDYLVMTALPGKPLGDVFRHMDPSQVDNIRYTLAAFLEQLRRIPSESPGVVSGPLPTLPCCDVGSRVDKLEFGPFHDVAAFHEYLLTRIPPELGAGLHQRVALLHKGRSSVYFTHGDLHLRNILVEDGQITGVVDWTCAGFYPSYWEPLKAIYPFSRFPQWVNMWYSISPRDKEAIELDMQMWTRDMM